MSDAKTGETTTQGCPTIEEPQLRGHALLLGTVDAAIFSSQQNWHHNESKKIAALKLPSGTTRHQIKNHISSKKQPLEEYGNATVDAADAPATKMRAVNSISCFLGDDPNLAGLQYTPLNFAYISSSHAPVWINSALVGIVYPLLQVQLTLEDIYDDHFNKDPKELFKQFFLTDLESENASTKIPDLSSCLERINTHLRAIYNRHTQMQKKYVSLELRYDLTEDGKLQFYLYTPKIQKKRLTPKITSEDKLHDFFKNTLRKFFGRIDYALYAKALFYWLSWALLAIIISNNYDYIIPIDPFTSFIFGIGIPITYATSLFGRKIFHWISNRFIFPETGFWNQKIKPCFDYPKDPEKGFWPKWPYLPKAAEGIIDQNFWQKLFQYIFGSLLRMVTFLWVFTVPQSILFSLDIISLPAFFILSLPTALLLLNTLWTFCFPPSNAVPEKSRIKLALETFVKKSRWIAFLLVMSLLMPAMPLVALGAIFRADDWQKTGRIFAAVAILLGIFGIVSYATNALAIFLAVAIPLALTATAYGFGNSTKAGRYLAITTGLISTALAVFLYTKNFLDLSEWTVMFLPLPVITGFLFLTLALYCCIGGLARKFKPHLTGISAALGSSLLILFFISNETGLLATYSWAPLFLALTATVLILPAFCWVMTGAFGISGKKDHDIYYLPEGFPDESDEKFDATILKKIYKSSYFLIHSGETANPYQLFFIDTNDKLKRLEMAKIPTEIRISLRQLANKNLSGKARKWVNKQIATNPGHEKNSRSLMTEQCASITRELSILHQYESVKETMIEELSSMALTTPPETKTANNDSTNQPLISWFSPPERVGGEGTFRHFWSAVEKFRYFWLTFVAKTVRFEYIAWFTLTLLVYVGLLTPDTADSFFMGSINAFSPGFMHVAAYTGIFIVVFSFFYALINTFYYNKEKNDYAKQHAAPDIYVVEKLYSTRSLNGIPYGVLQQRYAGHYVFEKRKNRIIYVAPTEEIQEIGSLKIPREIIKSVWKNGKISCNPDTSLKDQISVENQQKLLPLFWNKIAEHADHKDLPILQTQKTLQKISHLKNKVIEKNANLMHLELLLKTANIPIPLAPNIPNATELKNLENPAALRRNGKFSSAVTNFFKNPYWVSMAFVGLFWLNSIYPARAFFLDTPKPGELFIGTGISTFILQMPVVEIFEAFGKTFTPFISFFFLLAYIVAHALMGIYRKRLEDKDYAKRKQLALAPLQKECLEKQLDILGDHEKVLTALWREKVKPQDRNAAANNLLYCDLYPDIGYDSYDKKIWFRKLTYAFGWFSLALVFALFAALTLSTFASLLPIKLIAIIFTPFLGVVFLTLFSQTLVQKNVLMKREYYLRLYLSACLLISFLLLLSLTDTWIFGDIAFLCTIPALFMAFFFTSSLNHTIYDFLNEKQEEVKTVLSLTFENSCVFQGKNKNLMLYVITQLLTAMNPNCKGRKIDAASWGGNVQSNDYDPEKQMFIDFTELNYLKEKIRADEPIDSEMREKIQKIIQSYLNCPEQKQIIPNKTKTTNKITDKTQFIETISLVFLIIMGCVAVYLPAAILEFENLPGLHILFAIIPVICYLPRMIVERFVFYKEYDLLMMPEYSTPESFPPLSKDTFFFTFDEKEVGQLSYYTAKTKELKLLKSDISADKKTKLESLLHSKKTTTHDILTFKAPAEILFSIFPETREIWTPQEKYKFFLARYFSINALTKFSLRFIINTLTLSCVTLLFLLPALSGFSESSMTTVLNFFAISSETTLFAYSVAFILASLIIIQGALKYLALIPSFVETEGEPKSRIKKILKSWLTYFLRYDPQDVSQIIKYGFLIFDIVLLLSIGISLPTLSFLFLMNILPVTLATTTATLGLIISIVSIPLSVLIFKTLLPKFLFACLVNKNETFEETEKKKREVEKACKLVVIGVAAAMLIGGVAFFAFNQLSSPSFLVVLTGWVVGLVAGYCFSEFFNGEPKKVKDWVVELMARARFSGFFNSKPKAKNRAFLPPEPSSQQSLLRPISGEEDTAFMPMEETSSQSRWSPNFFCCCLQDSNEKNAVYAQLTDTDSKITPPL